MLPAVTSFLRDGKKRTLLEAIRCDYNKHRCYVHGSSQSSGRGDEEVVDLDALLEKDMMLTEVKNASDVTEEWYMATKTL